MIDVENKYGTKDVQEYLLPILKDLDALCRENDIKYSMMGGGLLGTVRHKGFIPWDDDLDLIFDRENYDKFLKVCETKLPDEYMVTNSIWIKRITRKDNPRLKEEEGCIDLFVFDNVPDDSFKKKTKNLKLMILQGMMKVNIPYEKYNFKQKVASFSTYLMGRVFSQKKKEKMYDKASKIGNDSPTKYINNYRTYYEMIDFKYSPDLIKSYIDAEFEGIKVMIFENYESALNTQFGDWHTLPSEDKRKPKHLKNV